MSGRRVGKNPEKFARALVGGVENKEILLGVIQSFESFLPNFIGNHTLRSFLENPLVPTSAKKEVVDKIADLPPLGRTFLKVILDAGGEKEIGHILSRSIDLGHTALRKIPVRVTTAVPLSEDLMSTLETKLKEKLQSEVVLQADVDPEVIGGIRIAWEGKVLDGTIPGRLHRMESFLLGSDA